jgi:hypothetical protein
MASPTSSKEAPSPSIPRPFAMAPVAASSAAPDLEHRSTAEQQQAFLEHLYSDYGELHVQQEEIHDRKNQMVFDMFESNHQEIHDVLFANVETSDGALGDWDTWEKVESVMKCYAYGRPRHTAQEKEEGAAMRSRIDALNEILRERNATIQSLTQTCTAVQQELGGLLKLVHMKDKEIKALSNKHHVASLQLRYVQRECAALRGLRNENETSLLKEDLKYLIEANKKLEAENQLLQSQQQVGWKAWNAPQTSSKGPQTAPSGEPPLERSNVFVPSQPSPSLGLAAVDVRGASVEDDAFRHALFQRELPISSVVVSAKRQNAHWKRRLAAEVSTAMELLDYDAAAPAVEAAPSSFNAMLGRGSLREGLLSPQPQNGAFISYASYDTVPHVSSQRNATPVLVAPTAALTSLTATTTAVVVSSSPAANPAEAAIRGAGAMVEGSAEVSHGATGNTAATRPSVVHDTHKNSRKSAASSGVSNHARGSVSNGAGATRRKSSQAASTVARKRSSAVPSANGVGGAALRSALLRCAELSRANAMRRELLHVAHLRQMLADERVRAATRESENTREKDTKPQSGGEQQREGDNKVEMEASWASLHSSDEPRPTSAPQRLRQCVNDSRSSLPEAQVRESNGGEVQSSAAHAKPAAEDSDVPPHRSPPSPTCMPKPQPPLSRPPSSPVRPSGHDRGEHRVVISTAPALQRQVSCLQGDVATLRSDVVMYWTQLQEALALLGRLFVEHEQHITQAAEEQAKDDALEGVAERVLEEVALQRTAQILRERFGCVLPDEAVTQAALSDSATDEEWVVHELQTVATAMIKESVHPTAASHSDAGRTAEDGAQRGSPSRASGAVGCDQRAPAAAPLPRQERQHPSLAERDYFAEDVLRPYRQQPNYANGGTLRRGVVTHGTDSGVRWRSGASTTVDREEWREGIDAAADFSCTTEEGRAAGGVEGGSRNRPAPPTRWHWRRRENAASVARPSPQSSIATRRPIGFTSAAVAPAAGLLSSTSPTSLQSIQPTVLRYVFRGNTGAETARQRAVSQRIQQKTAFLYGSEFEEFVQEYIVPVISTASRISAGGKMNAAMRAAVQELRQKERQRRKRGVRLLFDRVANNIRTRQLLQRSVYHGEAFVSYVGFLYRNWRARVERDRRRLQTAQETNRNALFSLLQLRTSLNPGDTLTKPTPPSVPPSAKTRPPAAATKCVVKAALAKSSFHFDRVKFNAKSGDVK